MLDIAEDSLARIEDLDPGVHAFLHVDRDHVLAQARAIDSRVKSGDREGALLGVPVAIKDNLCIAGLPTTCASRILEGYRPTYDATVVERLRAAGALLIGKTNLDEYAMGASTENSAWFPTRNPHDLKRVAGGSSGGSAAAIASGMALCALGSDTGGSVRQPASFCGLTGLRPTYGLVSRYGLVAFASSLDQVGPLALNAEDTEILLSVIAGPDARDSTCRTRPLAEYRRDLPGLRGVRIGAPPQYESDAIDRPVRQAMARLRAALEEAGAEFVRVDLPLTDYAIPTYYLVVTSEASSNLARFDGVRYGPRSEGADLADLYRRTRGRGFGDEVKRRIMLGTFALSSGYYDAYYKKALQVRQMIAREFDAAFSKVDFILGPTAPTPAFNIGEKSSDPLQLYLCDVFTAPSSLAGIPGLSVPVGFTESRLPIGAQILGPPGSDFRILRLARDVERLLGIENRPAEVSRGA